MNFGFCINKAWIGNTVHVKPAEHPLHESRLALERPPVDQREHVSESLIHRHFPVIFLQANFVLLIFTRKFSPRRVGTWIFWFFF